TADAIRISLIRGVLSYCGRQRRDPIECGLRIVRAERGTELRKRTENCPPSRDLSALAEGVGGNASARSRRGSKSVGGNTNDERGTRTRYRLGPSTIRLASPVALLAFVRRLLYRPLDRGLDDETPTNANVAAADRREPRRGAAGGRAQCRLLARRMAHAARR